MHFHVFALSFGCDSAVFTNFPTYRDGDLNLGLGHIFYYRIIMFSISNSIFLDRNMITWAFYPRPKNLLGVILPYFTKGPAGSIDTLANYANYKPGPEKQSLRLNYNEYFNSKCDRIYFTFNIKQYKPTLSCNICQKIYVINETHKRNRNYLGEDFTFSRCTPHFHFQLVRTKLSMMLSLPNYADGGCTSTSMIWLL